ncbi:MAG: tetratricopeptide repeat protein [Planctomycetota bacterium]|nr:tetratricopeptide repeat protein [Planctomycetota bacterium]
MADESQNLGLQTPPQGPAVTPAVRKRLQTWFNHGQEKSASGGLDYATDLFVQCVEGDPASLDYLQAFLKNLYKKYNNNKKGAGFFAGFKGRATKATQWASPQKDWPAVIKNGLTLLKLNPWDTTALTNIAAACEALHCQEAQLGWLRAALEVDAKDPDINRLCALALGKQGHFDQAIVCWARVEKARPNDEEAQRSISQMQVEKTTAQINHRSEREAASAAAEKAAETDSGGIRLTRQQVLQQTIASNPADIDAYLELGELHTREERFNEAERILRSALEASGGDLRVREQYEELHLKRSKAQVAMAERRASQENTDEARSLHQRMKGELNRLEIEVFRARSDRYPAMTSWKIELGIRLKRSGNFTDAIKTLQEARNDVKRKGLVLLELGECFQQIKQYKLAMTNYVLAIEALTDKDLDTRKKALYRAGVLAMGLDELETAERWLSELAGLEFGYRDVAERLDKIASVRHKG